MERDTYTQNNIIDGTISTHTLTWSVTSAAVVKGLVPFNFNSHAHVERDSKGITAAAEKGISTHTLTWSVT